MRNASSAVDAGLVSEEEQGLSGIAQRTTLTPIDLAVPTMLLQIDSRRTNSLPGSVCFTCGGR